MDMPVNVSDYFCNINIENIVDMVDEYRPAWDVIKHTWSHETLQEMMDGKVSVPDDMINDAIAERLQAMDPETAPITDFKLTSKKNGRLEIYAKTKKAGRVEFSGTIEEFVHNKDDSHVTYRVKERALKDHGLASWFFSRISLSMAQKLFGKIDLGEDLPTTIKGNYITLDCKNILEQSELAATEVKGYRLLDMIEIKSAVPCDGYIMFETSLNIPQELQYLAVDMLMGN